MKKALIIILVLACLAGCLSGCGGDKVVESMDFAALSTALLDAGIYSDLMSPLEKDIAAMLYSLDESDISECMLYCGTGATVEEIALFKAVDEAAAGRIAQAANNRKAAQKTSFENYVPEELPKLDKAIIKSSGLFVVYIVATDDAKAQEILKAYM